MEQLRTLLKSTSLSLMVPAQPHDPVTEALTADILRAQSR
jgi:hypothetical protein